MVLECDPVYVVDAADPLGRVDALPESRVGYAYRLVLHACRVAGPRPLLYQRPQLLAEPRDLLPACSLHVPSHRNLPGESPAAQQEARVRYRILRHVLYAGTVANDIAQAFCRQVDRLSYFFLTAFRVSPEILGGRPERVRVCRPAMPSFRYRLCHLTPHDGAMPRRARGPGHAHPVSLHQYVQQYPVPHLRIPLSLANLEHLLVFHDLSGQPCSMTFSLVDRRGQSRGWILAFPQI